MQEFILLGRRFGFDLVAFARIMNWGTFSDEEYQRRAVHLKSHPSHQEFREILQGEIFQEPIAYAGNLSEFMG